MNQYANFGTRLSCHVADILIIQLIVLPLFFSLKFLAYTVDYELMTLIIWGVYSTVFNASTNKGTYGKKMLGVKVEMENGERLNLLQSAARYIIGFLLFPLIIGMIPIFFNRKRKGLHDLLIGSVVKYR